jgi:hypothetical protein
MKSIVRNAALCALTAFGLAGLAANAAGEVLVINETAVDIHPWFRYNCFGFTPDPSTVSNGWVNFGGIGAGGRFGWDFNDPFLTAPGCAKPHLQYTFTAFGGPPPVADPEFVANIKFDPGTNFHVQMGGKLRAINMLDD